jgi:hypothetical protein
MKPRKVGIKKLKLQKDTLKRLNDASLGDVNGAYCTPTFCSCWCPRTAG